MCVCVCVCVCVCEVVCVRGVGCSIYLERVRGNHSILSRSVRYPQYRAMQMSVYHDSKVLQNDSKFLQNNSKVLHHDSKVLQQDSKVLQHDS